MAIIDWIWPTGKLTEVMTIIAGGMETIIEMTTRLSGYSLWFLRIGHVAHDLAQTYHDLATSTAMFFSSVICPVSKNKQRSMKY